MRSNHICSFILSILLALLPSQGKTQALERSCSNELADSVIETILKNDGLWTLQKQVLAFHWEIKDQREQPFITKENGPAKLAEMFLETGGANGYYFAMDPVTSSDYGRVEYFSPLKKKLEWRLIILTLPQGSLFLNLKSFTLHDNLQKTLGPGCNCAEHILGAFDVTPSEDKSCDELKKTVFSILHQKYGLAGIRYKWTWPKTFNIDSQLCPTTDYTALIITNPDWLKQVPYRIYTQTSRFEIGTTEEKRILQNLFTKYSPSWNDPSNFKFQLPKNSFNKSSMKKLSSETKSWMKSNLMNCNSQITNLDKY